MTSIRNISRGLGAGMIGLSLVASLSVGGCGGTGSDNSATFVDPGVGPNQSSATATELTRILYRFGPGGLDVPAGTAFYQLTLVDAAGAPVVAGSRGDSAGKLRDIVSAGSSAQFLVPDDAVTLVKGTTVDMLATNGELLVRYITPISVVKNQTTIVSSGDRQTPAVSSISLFPSTRQGQTSLDPFGTLLANSGGTYPLAVFATYGTGSNATTTTITSGVDYSVTPSRLGSFQDNVFIPSTTVAAGSVGTITASFGGQVGTLPVNVTGAAAPTPTPSPSSSPSGSPSPSSSASPSGSPTPAASVTPTPSPGTSPSPVPISSVRLIITDPAIRNTASSAYGVDATVNNQTVNVTTLTGANVSVTSSNTSVVLPDIPNLRLNGVGVGLANITGSISINGINGSVPIPPVQMTVNP